MTSVVEAIVRLQKQITDASPDVGQLIQKLQQSHAEQEVRLKVLLATFARGIG